ncbi:Asp-tRNA(Asn)/Glu-tRNA(Gln) amidotransferase subunit GatC [Candidatus Berkelbacteria bacterium]|nr:Asp-tRNA(Asn)/Glu-tRNA(Gln) amidotransferase subunit GatC [Candidatus Berkelbacteria bacterium]
MSEISVTEIERLAALVRLELTEAEKQNLTTDLPKILNFVEQLRLAKLESDSLDKEVLALEDLRSDEVSETNLSLGEIEKLAPQFKNDQVIVPAVFGESEDE